MRTSLLILPFLLSLFSCSEKGAVKPAITPPKAGFVIARSSSVDLFEDYTGRTQAWRSADVRARVSGIIEQRLFEEGDTVEKGDVLFQLDALPYQLAVNDAKATLARAQANLTLTKTAWQRAKALLPERSISQQAYDSARANYEQAIADKETAQANLNSSELQLSYTRITAPISGHIGRAMVSEGNLVQAEDTAVLATIRQTDPMYVSFFQPVSHFNAQQTVAFTPTLTVSTTNTHPVSLSGTIMFTETATRQTTDEVNVIAKVSNSNARLLADQYVSVRVKSSSIESAVLVPQQVVTRNDSGDFLWVLLPDNTAQRRTVQIAGSREGQWVVTQGLSDGEKLIVDGFQRIREGQPVTPVNTGQPENAGA